MGYSIYNNALHIVSEYIKGSNLDDLLSGDQCQQITFFKKCYIAEKISQAVAYLHNSSPIILHRDFKPENIILSESLEVVKLCDLGISKLLTINSSATTYAPTRYATRYPYLSSTRNFAWQYTCINKILQNYSVKVPCGGYKRKMKKKIKCQLLKQLKTL